MKVGNLLFLFLVTLCVSAQAQSAFPVSDSVEVVFLANEGFLLRSGSTAVLIDAFVTKPYSIYGAMPPDTYQQLMAGGFPYQNVKLALASHVHRDHFQPEAAGAFLQHHPNVRFVSSRQIRDTLQTHFPEYDDIERQVQVLWPAPGEEEHLETGELKIDFLRLRHTNPRNYSIENLGHIIHMGNKIFLHIGDAEMLAKHYQEYNLSSRSLDIAFIPFWFFLSEEGRNIVENHINAAHYVAMHIPPDEYDEIISNLNQHFPSAIVFEEAGYLKRF